MNRTDIINENMSPLALAYLGDAVYELNIREYLVSTNLVKVNDLFKESTKYVSAKSQAKYLEELINKNFFTEEELDVIRRGRNAKSHKAPKNTDILTYKHSTGFECLIGYLYIKESKDRIKEIIKEIIGD